MTSDSDPVAYFITWTTYGSWLPGDQRTWVDHPRSGHGARLFDEDKRRAAYAKSLLKQHPVVLTPQQRTCIEETIRSLCEFRKWTLHAVNCRTNHVHVVVSAPDCSPEKVLNQMKAWCSRRLNEQPDGASQTRRWTRHGSTRYLNDEDSVHRAVHYTLHEQ